MAFGSFECLRKLDIFLWRAIREVLPTKVNLFKRQGVADGLYEQCHDSVEDSIHALWYCDSVKPI